MGDPVNVGIEGTDRSGHSKPLGGLEGTAGISLSVLTGLPWLLVRVEGKKASRLLPSLPVPVALALPKHFRRLEDAFHLQQWPGSSNPVPFMLF